MKKLLSLALILVVFSFGACKKSEEKPQTESPAAKAAEPKQKRKRDRDVPAPVALEIYDEANLVGTVGQDDYATLSSTKIKVGRQKKKEVDGVLLSDLLKKYNVTGKSVILAGPKNSVPLTWEQATANSIYVFQGPRKQFQLSNQNETMRDLRLPAQLVKITVSEKEETASAAKTAKKPAT